MKESEPPAVTSHVIKICQNKYTHSKKKSSYSYLNFNPSLNLRKGQKKTKKSKKKTKKEREQEQKQEMRNERGGYM